MGTESATPFTASTSEPGLLARAAWQVRQFICGLHGHDELLHFERGRISLLCATCGHESPGWEVQAGASPVDRVQSAPRVVRMPLVREQRVA